MVTSELKSTSRGFILFFLASHNNFTFGLDSCWVFIDITTPVKSLYIPFLILTSEPTGYLGIMPRKHATNSLLNCDPEPSFISSYTKSGDNPLRYGLSEI